MEKFHLATTSLFALLMISCDQSSPNENSYNSSRFEVSKPATDAGNSITNPTTSLSAPAVNPPHGQPGHRCDIAVGAQIKGGLNTANHISLGSLPAIKAPNIASFANAAIPSNQNLQAASSLLPTTNSVPILNPAHGKPGHRCDIAVGDPLTSAAATTAPAKLTPAQSSPVVKGLNPAHGQPGHRCDIAVGSPLSSAPPPKETAQQPTVTGTRGNITNTVTNSQLVTPNLLPPILQSEPTPAKSATPLVSMTALSDTTTKAGLNPKHGQPGHRCDIAVGAQLDSKPKQ